MSRHPKDRSGALLTFARARLSRLKQACCVLPALLALTVMACAGAPTPSTGSDLVGSPYPGGPWDPAELEGFLDRAISTQLDAEHLRGATVAVVRDGRLLLAKGYGFADEAGRTPVVADQTLFRIGSVTKLFTATAVMQLVEQGQLDLRADVNTYLRGFRIPATHPQPITLAHLLTHTAGFEERATIMPASSAELWPLGQHLANRQPARVRPPGELASYSNYGMALAGHIVAEVSGVPFERYIEERILRPLEMRRSSVQQPPPPELDSLLSGGFMSVGGAFQPRPFEYVQDAPAGAVSATATDMANFMLAHLQHGRFGQQRILQDATAQEMLSRAAA
jgi:CubicO group peptidase (beta-lactamase class C family)